MLRIRIFIIKSVTSLSDGSWQALSLPSPLAHIWINWSESPCAPFFGTGRSFKSNLCPTIGGNFIQAAHPNHDKIQVSFSPLSQPCLDPLGKPTHALSQRKPLWIIHLFILSWYMCAINFNISREFCTECAWFTQDWILNSSYLFIQS